MAVAIPQRLAALLSAVVDTECDAVQAMLDAAARRAPGRTDRSVRGPRSRKRKSSTFAPVAVAHLWAATHRR